MFEVESFSAVLKCKIKINRLEMLSFENHVCIVNIFCTLIDAFLEKANNFDQSSRSIVPEFHTIQIWLKF